MIRFTDLCFFFVIILIVGSEVSGNKRRQGSSFCQKCGRRMPALEGKRGKERVVNGRQVKPAFMYPWIVKIEAYRRCSGSIISQRYIITSAYCLTNSESDKNPNCKKNKLPIECLIQKRDIKIRLPWRDSIKFRGTLKAESLMPHPDYQHPSIQNDIALVRVTKDIKCNSFYQPICLPHEDLNKIGAKLIVTGWRVVTSDGGVDGNKVLREGDLRQLPLSHCYTNSYFLALKSDNGICVAGTKEMACRGDSGAAIFARFGKAYYAVGLSSLPEKDPPKCKQRLPLTLLKVHAYMDWIKQFVKRFPEPYKQYGYIEDMQQEVEPEEKSKLFG